MSYQFVISTCPDKSTAQRIAGELVKRRLAACVNIVPGIVSIYEWKEEVCQDDEVLLLIKTRGERYGELEQAIVALHPYELPEVIALPIESGLAGYLGWVEQQTEER